MKLLGMSRKGKLTRFKVDLARFGSEVFLTPSTLNGPLNSICHGDAGYPQPERRLAMSLSRLNLTIGAVVGGIGKVQADAAHSTSGRAQGKQAPFFAPSGCTTYPLCPGGKCECVRG